MSVIKTRERVVYGRPVCKGPPPTESPNTSGEGKLPYLGAFVPLASNMARIEAEGPGYTATGVTAPSAPHLLAFVASGPERL